MEFKDFTIAVNGNRIIEVEHKEFDVNSWIIETAEKNRLVNQGTSFVLGRTKSFKAWSDYHSEEASTDFYLAISKSDGAVKQYVLDDMESLFRYLHHDRYDVYRVRVEDNLF